MSLFDIPSNNNDFYVLCYGPPDKLVYYEEDPLFDRFRRFRTTDDPLSLQNIILRRKEREAQYEKYKHRFYLDRWFYDFRDFMLKYYPHFKPPKEYEECTENPFEFVIHDYMFGGYDAMKNKEKKYIEILYNIDDMEYVNRLNPERVVKDRVKEARGFYQQSA